MQCVKCGKEVPEQDGSGRPRKFCGAACKRASELEVKRLNALIAKVQAEESKLRINGAEPYARRAAEEVKRLEARLLDLLAEEDE
jgi:hypothetical protein